MVDSKHYLDWLTMKKDFRAAQIESLKWRIVCQTAKNLLTG